jgi:hypothetical protein
MSVNGTARRQLGFGADVLKDNGSAWGITEGQGYLMHLRGLRSACVDLTLRMNKARHRSPI